jgi:hypothetical protein
MFGAKFLSFPDVEAPSDGNAVVFVAATGRGMWKPITGALLSGFTAALVAFGASSGGGLTQDSGLSYTGAGAGATLALAGGQTIGGALNVGSTTDASDWAHASIVSSGGMACAKSFWMGADSLAGVQTYLNCAAANGAFHKFMSASVLRWQFGRVGSTHDFQLSGYDSSGVLTDVPLTIANAAGGAFTTVRPVSITNATAATSTTAAALVVTGGAGFGGKVYFGNTLTAAVNSGSTLNLDLTDTAASRSVAMFRVNTSATAHTSAALFDVVSSASTSSDKMVRVRANSVDVWTMAADGTGTWSGPQSFTNATASTSTSTGAVVVAGGVGVAGAAFIGGNVTIGGSTSGGYRLTVSSPTAKATTSTYSVASFGSSDTPGSADLSVFMRVGGNATAGSRWAGIMSYENGAGSRPLVLQDLGGNVLVGSTTDASTGALQVTGATIAASMLVSDSGTTNQVQALIVDHTSSGTPAAGFGTRFYFKAKSDTTVSRAQGNIASSWVVATDASRTGRMVLYASDFANDSREGMRVEATGSATAISFFGANAVTQRTMAAWTGTATRTTFATSTATLANVAEALKALIDDFRSLGTHA